jgi:zinc/manganese transport system ATP-binding protein
MTAGNAIRFDRVQLSLAGRSVLNRVSFTIRPGEFIGVLGPNGAGKTTLMRAVLGLLAPQNGQIEVLDRPATRGNPAVGYMPQMRSTAAGLRLSGWEFVAGVVNGHRLGLPRPGRTGRAEVDKVLGLVGAQNLARRPLLELSGGERQRLLLAQALIGQPRVLLLDEPLISLDPHHASAVVELVKKLQSQLAITVLFSAHELNPLLGALDRVLYLGGGEAALGAVEEVITGPVLSRLYGSNIDVLRVNGRIFVMSGQHDLQGDTHRHEGEIGHALHGPHPAHV